ncbi:hypothetical protein [Actinomadura coerulea]|uniref:hypothetical protein n=1 Tax=Actinomadura coerulea TaxID=46159 RepID=UPI0034420BE4
MRADRGGLWDLADIARRDRGLFPEAGPDLPERLRDALGVLDLRARDVRVERRWSGAGLDGEELSWTVGFGPRTRARLLRPRGAAGPLPGVLAAHCHAGMKWAGKDKIADGPEPPAPEDRYDRAARDHEHVLAKACTLLGTSFTGVLASEDLAAAAYLRSRPDIASDPDSASDADTASGADTGSGVSSESGTVLGSGGGSAPDVPSLAGAASVSAIGLSGGGVRAAILGALDPGVGAVVVAAAVSSFRDLREEHVAAHSWMLFPPGLTRLADWPGVVAARAPAPRMVLYAAADPLFPAAGMRRAHRRIAEAYRDAPGRYTGVFFDAPHRFDRAMQDAAFAWLAETAGGDSRR